MKRALAVGLVLAAAAAQAQQQCTTTRTVWPTDDWESAPVDAAAKAAEVAALEEYAFTLEGADSERKGYRTNALLIIKGGKVIYERYGRGFGPTNRHLSWSVAKSVSSALVGVAVKERALTLDDSICTLVPEYQGTDKCDITVKHAITFATGLAWQEEYENQTYQVSSVISMLMGSGHRDQLKHILDHKLAHAPGTHWSYSTGDAELASALAKRALMKKHGKDAFWTLLFEPIGMRRVTFEEDLLGTPLGGSMVFATPREFAKFGYLFLNDGCWNGTRIVPEGWVQASTTPSDVFVETADHEDEGSGYSWWLNRPIPSKMKPAPWPDAPEDMFAAQGHWGQRIIVVPSEDVVIVRTGDDRKGSIKINQLTKLSLAVAR